MSESCSRCARPSQTFSVDLPTPALLCDDCHDVALLVPFDDDAAWDVFVASCGQSVTR